MRKTTFITRPMKAAAIMLSMLSMPMLASAADWQWEAEGEAAPEQYNCELNTGGDQSEYSGKTAIGGGSVGYRSSLGYMIEGVPAAGMYDLTIHYASMQNRFLLVQVADRVPIVVDCTETTGNWDGSPGLVTQTNPDTNLEEEVMKPGVAQKTIAVYIPWEGDIDLKIMPYDGISATTGSTMPFMPNIDKITLAPSQAALVETPEAPADIVIEAEAYTSSSGTTGPSEENNSVNFSGQKGMSLKSAGKASYTVNVPEAGTYALYFDYTTMQVRWLTVKANTQERQYVEFNQTTQTWGNTPDQQDANRPLIYQKVVTLYLDEGENTITLESYTGTTSEHSDSPNLDLLTLRKVQADMTKPGVEVQAYPFSYTQLAKITSDRGEVDASVFDNNEYTEWNLSASTAVLEAEMPYPILLTGYAYASTNDKDRWKLEASNDKQQWTAIEGMMEETEGNYQTYSLPVTTLTFDGRTGYKYFRLTASGEGSVNIAEWQLFGSPMIAADIHLNEDILSSGNGELTASENGWNAGQEGGEGFEKLIDRKLTTKFTSTEVKSPSEKTPIWFQYELYTPVTAQSYSLTVPMMSDSGDLSSRDPRNWQLFGFSEEADDWVVLDTRTNVKFSTMASTMVFDIANPVECLGYRLEITANNGSTDNTHLGSWQVFENKQIGTGIGSVIPAAKGTLSAFGLNGSLHIATGTVTAYAVYTITGQTVATGTVSGTATVSLPAGIYIVKAAGQTKKVMVK